MGTIIAPPLQVEAHISAQPGLPAIGMRAYPDPTNVPPGTPPNEIVIGIMALALAWDRAVILQLVQRVAALEIAVAEGNASGGTIEERERRGERHQLAIAAVTKQAAQLTINAPPEPANDDAAPNDDGPASALDGIDPAAL